MAKEKETTVNKTSGYSENARTPELRIKQYTKEELNGVFDVLMFEGEYKEEVTIRGKLKVTFRTRTADETMGITRQLDMSDYKLLPTVQEQRAYLNITKSLINYQGKDLVAVKDDEKAAYIKRLPTSIISALADALAEFDRKVDLACRDAETSF